MRCLIVAAGLMCVLLAGAKEGSCQLTPPSEMERVVDKDAKYDIYWLSGDVQLNVVRDVKVVETKNIANRLFLAVQATEMKLQKGFILLEAIIAILPAGQAVDVKRYFSNMQMQ